MIIITKADTKQKILTALLFFFDIIMFIFGYAISNYIMSGNSGIVIKNWYNIVISFALIVFFFVMYDLYVIKIDRIFNLVISVTLSILAMSVGTVIIVHLLKFEAISVSVWCVRAMFIEITMVLWRVTVAILIKKFGDKRKCLVIENMNNTSRLVRKIKYSSDYGRTAEYYLIDEDNEEELKIILNQKLALYDLIFISPAISQDIADKITSKAYSLGKDVSVLADLDRVTTMRGQIYQIDDTPIIAKKTLNMTRFQRCIKRTFDIVFSLVICIITFPIFLLCALLVKISSTGPVIYKQERYTRNKKKFNVYKFRTMVQDAEKFGAQFATEDDPRITKVGKFLRATRLDELPQFYNILEGNMSVVGPRPERPVFADYFSENVKNYDMRYCVKAGLTGYAQIYGKYNTRVSDKILMDMIYVVNYSFMLDIKIIFLTVKTMFVKSATEGIDEERDKMLVSEENEKKRREETLRQLGL
ncbi:MAG: sugar transferase [Firmicutes bacterium]|nr:sugar transferase [Bacillota bacterium]